MIQIFDKSYSTMRPIEPSINAVAVFNFESAKIAFNHTPVDFVVALNEESGKFGYCNSLDEVFRFFGEEKKYLPRKIYESETVVIWAGLGDEVIQEMETVLPKKDKMFIIFATAKNYADFNFTFPESMYLGLYQSTENMDDDFIINYVTRVSTWSPVVGK